MVALKSVEIDRFLAHPPEDVNVVLIYGPDAGLVSERAQALTAVASKDSDDPFSLVKLEAADVVADPSRLIDEALTIPLFGGRRVIWVKDCGGKNMVPAVDPLLKENGRIALVILEAGDLKKTATFRKRIETHRTAVAVPCYQDGARDVDKLIDEEARLAGLSVSREARHALHELLGADRLASRGELRKLCLYAHGKERIDTSDIAAIMGDASSFAMDELIDAVATGELTTVDHGLERLEAAGSSIDQIANATLRHFQMLHKLRAMHDEGIPAKQLVERTQPPIFFQRRDAVARQISLWQRADIEKAMDLLGGAILKSRLNQALGIAILSDAILALARVARARSARR